MAGREPAGIFEFGLIHPDFAASVVGDEGGHQLAGKRPALAPHIADIGDLHPGFLLYFPRHTLLQAFAEVEEACYQAETPGGPLCLAGEEELFSISYQHDDAWMDVGIMLKS